MASEAGEDLSWWWRGWYMDNAAVDIGVAKIAYIGGDPSKGLHVELTNRGKLVMPAPLDVAFRDGTHLRVTVPVEAWMQSNTAAFDLVTMKPVASVTIDPDHKLPEADRADDRGVPAAAAPPRPARP